MSLAVDGVSEDLLPSSDQPDEPPLDTSADGLNTCRAIVPSLHSQAEVKFALMDYVPRFSRPPLSTDLHAPLCTSPTRPPAGDHGGGGGSYSFTSHQHVPPEFVSFNIANMSLDSLDGVQVISDAKNIKKLLKLAYGRNTELSMTVHRVGGLLLLDDYDVTRHVLGGRQSQWRWLDRLLREFFFQTFEDTDWPRRIQCEQLRSALAVKSSRLFSQLLQHVLRDAAPPSLSPPSASLLPLSPALSTSSSSSLALPAAETASSQTLVQSSPPAKYRRHYFSRNMLWTFQDLKMLIGTDMPILGGGTHPCVSLRLHDLSENINVLTGLDYWLDNLMSNVPEVLMCYHLNGVIKNFSLVRTEDLPQLRGSSFRPDVVHDVAENILTFLSDSATKTGHTYWLFKGEKDDFVKLYDLTSLLESRYESFTVDDNPFTGHVAILLYRIACNMIKNRHSVDNGDRLGTLRTLLEKCLELMQGDKYLQVRANILLMLTECFVPRDHVPLSTHFVDSDRDQQASTPPGPSSSPDDHEDSTDHTCPATDIVLSVPAPSLDLQTAPRLSLDDLSAGASDPRPQGRGCDLVGPAGDLRPTPVRGGALERVAKALTLVSHALVCVRQWRRMAEEGMREVRPFEAIPMPYFRLDESLPTDCPLNDTPDDSTPTTTTTASSSSGGSSCHGDGDSSSRDDYTPVDDEASAGRQHDGNGSDVSESLLLQKAGQLCCVLSSALNQEPTDTDSVAEDRKISALQAAVVGLLAVRSASRPDLVPEVTAASSILLADGVLYLCRLPLAELVAVYMKWSDPAQLQTLTAIVGSTRGFLEIPCTVESLLLEAERLLLLAEQTLRQCVKLRMGSSTRHQLRCRLGLVLNELGLVRKRIFDQYIDSNSASADCAKAKKLFEAAEQPLVECVSLLEAGVDRCVAEWNLAHLCDRWALSVCIPHCARHSTPSTDCTCDASLWLEKASDHYSNCLTISHRCTPAATARLSRLLPPTAPRFDQLVTERRAAAAAACCDHVTGLERLRRLLGWCRVEEVVEGEREVQRRVCGHTAQVLARLAAVSDHDSRCVQERRCHQLRSHSAQLFQQAAEMYQRSGHAHSALHVLHDALISRELDVQMAVHWKERVRCLKQSLLMVAGRESPINRILSDRPVSGDSNVTVSSSSDLEVEAERIVVSLVNTIKFACILIRRNSQSQSKSSLLACYEDLYRLALSATTASSDLFTHRLARLVQHVQATFDKSQH